MDAAFLSRRIPTATTFSEIATVLSIRVRFAALKPRLKCSRGVIRTTSATGLRTRLRFHRYPAPLRERWASTWTWLKLLPWCMTSAIYRSLTSPKGITPKQKEMHLIIWTRSAAFVKTSRKL